MTIFVDENIPSSSIEVIKKLDHTVLDIRGSDKEGISDVEIFVLAQENKAVFLTTDKDFYHTIHFQNKPHYGIIVINLSQPNARNIKEKVEWVLKYLENHPIESKCLLLRKSRCLLFE